MTDHPDVPRTQDAPAMDQHPVTAADKIAGIVAQVRADAADLPDDRTREMLRQRLQDAGLSTDAATEQSAWERIRGHD